ncbi:hypothetical protein RFI_18119, partial [Reticulomyxa filosa]
KKKKGESSKIDFFFFFLKKKKKTLLSIKNLYTNLTKKVSPELDCSVDICYVPGSASNKHLIIHVSGVHGVEGFAGSAIQIFLLRQVLPHLGYGKTELENTYIASQAGQEYKSDDDRPHIVFVHSLNPTGMAMGRRFTIDNIDLNRNVIFDEDKWKQVTQMSYTAEAEINGEKTSYMPNREYSNFRWFLTPNRMPSFWKDDVWFWAQTAWQLLLYGFDALSKVVVTGQYHDPKGLYYGGQKLSPEHEALTHFLLGKKDLSKGLRLEDMCDRNVKGFDKVSLIDVHTGLGKKGMDTLLTSYVHDYKKLKQIFQNDEDYVKDGIFFFPVLFYYM